MKKTIWSYLTEIRLKNSIQLLLHTDIPIGDIDEKIGINSRQNFYKLFKSKYNISPSEYRNRNSSL
jgi:transcriptional regulator GlxA family with amidase domain